MLSGSAWCWEGLRRRDKRFGMVELRTTDLRWKDGLEAQAARLGVVAGVEESEEEERYWISSR